MTEKKQTVREWARANGYPGVKDTGRIADKIVAAARDAGVTA